MKKHGCLWWGFIGWWWVPVTLPIRIPVALIRKAKAMTSSGKLVRLPAKTPPEDGKTHKVAGTSYRQEAIKSLGVKNPDFLKSTEALRKAGLVDKPVYEYDFAPKKVELQPEPDNPHDPKAIKVIVDGVHIGYIKAGSCAHIHKLLKADGIKRISCFISGGKCKRLYYDEDGKYTLEQDSIPFYARLSIYT